MQWKSSLNEYNSKLKILGVKINIWHGFWKISTFTKWVIQSIPCRRVGFTPIYVLKIILLSSLFCTLPIQFLTFWSSLGIVLNILWWILPIGFFLSNFCYWIEFLLFLLNFVETAIEDRIPSYCKTCQASIAYGSCYLLNLVSSVMSD